MTFRVTISVVVVSWVVGILFGLVPLMGWNKGKENFKVCVCVRACVHFGKSLVLVAMYKVKSLRTQTNCFIASLAVADILTGLVVGPLAVISHIGLPHNFYGCLLINSLVILFTSWVVGILFGLVPLMGWNKGKENFKDSLPSLAPLRIPLGSKLVKDDIVRDLVFESTETI
nr:hypothetical protein BaRGS_007006 [Batillaria attramentaria]